MLDDFQFSCNILYCVCLCIIFSTLQSPPDNHEISILKFLCLKNVNDDYCEIALEKFASDKSAPDFSVRIYCMHIL